MTKLGFGCLRLPTVDEISGEVDTKQFCQMVDLFMAAGFNYFDTAHTYLNGESERAIREWLVERYPRESFLLANKLTTPLFKSEEDIRPLFQTQLSACGVEYFDYYLMHGLSERLYERFVSCSAFDVVKQLKAENKIRHLGISFHDKPAVLDRILEEHPEIEAVQIQLNYTDYDDPIVESGAVYEVCRRFDKPVLIMEPVRGGSLAQNLPEEALKILSDLRGGSPASYALRYAAAFDGVFMVLSGMSSVEQAEDNIRCMRDFRPLTEQELAAVDQVREILKRQDLIACTACRYCVEGCPEQILIPRLFACLNAKKKFQDLDNYGSYVHYTAKYGKASDCIGCGQCERVCPQHLPVVAILKEVAEIYDRQGGASAVLANQER